MILDHRLRLGLFTLGLLGLGLITVGLAPIRIARAEEGAPPLPTQTIEFDTSEVTEASIDVAPDGSWLVFTLLGDLYRLPIAGGTAEALTEGDPIDAGPRVSPDGKSVAFISDREGEGIYLLDLGSKAVRKVTTALERPARLRWTADGRQLVAQVETKRGRIGQRHAVVVSLADGSSKPAPELVPGTSWPTGDYLDDATTGARRLSPRGNWIAEITTQTRGVDRLRVRSAKGGDAPRELNAQGLLYHASVAEIPDFSWLPDESALVIYGDGQLRRVPLDGSPAAAIPFQAHVRFMRAVGAGAACVAPNAKKVWNPRGISDLAIAPPSGKTTLYGSAGNLFIAPFRRATGQIVTQGPNWEYRPLWAPDGRGFVFQRFDGYEVTSWLKDLPKEADKDQVLNLRTPEHQVAEPGVSYRIEGWHPDGERLLVSESLENAHRLSIFDPAAGTLTPLWTTGSPVTPAPFFGPQDQDLYFTDLDDSGMPNLYKLPLARPDKAVAVTRFESGARESRLSPDQTQVLFRRGFGLFAAPAKTASGPPSDRDAEQISESNDGIYGWFFNSKNAYLCDGATFTGVRVDDREEVTFDVENIFGVPPKGLDAVVDGVTLIDVVNGTATPDRSIVIAGGRIIRIVSPSEAQSEPGGRVDGEGLFAIPGLIDLASSWGEVLPRQVLGSGITTVLDRGSELPFLFATRDAVDASLMPGPRSFGSGPRLERGSLHALSIESTTEAEAAVRHLAERGCEWIDLGSSLARDAQKAAVRAATARTLPVGQTGSDLGALLAAIADGAHAITGTPGAGPHGDVIQLLAKSEVVWSPAIGAIATDERAHREPGLFDQPRWAPTLSKQLLAESSIQSSSEDHRDRLVGALAQQAVDALRGGAQVVAATDSPGAFRLHGVTLCSELEAMVAAGATPAEALRAATSTSAKALGLGASLGAIAPGNLADLVLLRANPLDRISAIEEVEVVMREGRAWKASELLAKPKVGGAIKPEERK